MTYIQMSVEEFHQRADAVFQRAEQCMTEYDREKLKNFMHKSKQWGNVAEWQAKHLRECELTYSDEFLEEVRTYEANYTEATPRKVSPRLQLLSHTRLLLQHHRGCSRGFIQGTSDDYRPPYSDYHGRRTTSISQRFGLLTPMSPSSPRALWCRCGLRAPFLSAIRSAPTTKESPGAAAGASAAASRNVRPRAGHQPIQDP